MYTISDSESGTSSHDTNGNQKYINADEIYEISEDECDQTVDAKGEDFNNSVDDSVHSKNQQHDEKEPKESGTLDKDVQDAPEMKVLHLIISKVRLTPKNWLWTAVNVFGAVLGWPTSAPTAVSPFHIDPGSRSTTASTRENDHSNAPAAR